MALLRQCLAELRFMRGDIDDDTAFLEPSDDAFLGALMHERGSTHGSVPVPERRNTQVEASIGIRVSGHRLQAMPQPVG
ncbi:hypothetical protein [Azohydromonas australica]|uniref:hypothetical protein n=1 Tax=Azohydromonas australica TaxID=364039 RepID=UPI00040200E0|nr:hypothetical protein [Azohydromonas australica]